MSRPNPVYRHKTIFCTRRAHGGCYILNPTPETRDIIAFLAVYYALKHNIRLLVFVILGNHVHWVGDDPEGTYPDFLRDFHSAVTLVLHRLHGRSGILWEPRKPSRVRLEGPRTVMQKLVYVATNPVKHGIVRNSALWPGSLFSPEKAGETILYRRPAAVAECLPSLPGEISYTVPVPWVYGDTPIAKVRQDFRRRRRDHEARLAARRPEPFIGRAAALALGPDDYAGRAEPRPNLVFAADPDLELATLADLDSWLRDYARTRQRFRAGKCPTWPPGTYAMHRWHNCPRHGP